jgi:hypothetical protein
MSTLVSVQLAVVAALAAELTALAAELEDDAALCSGTAEPMASALPGPAGWAAADVGTAWAGFVAVLAERTRAIAGTLAAAVDSYRATDQALAERLAARRSGAIAVAW